MGNRKYSIKRQMKLARELRAKFNQTAAIEVVTVVYKRTTGPEGDLKFKVFWKIGEDCQIEYYKSWEELETGVQELLK